VPEDIQVLAFADRDFVFNVTAVKGMLLNAVNSGRFPYPVTITEDTYKYKVGFLKSEVTPCLIISHQAEPKDYHKFVIVIKHDNENATTVFLTGYYGDSLSDRYILKASKLRDKQDKSFAKAGRQYDTLYDQVTSGLGHTAMGLVSNARANSIVKKQSQRVRIEAAYDREIISLISGLYQYIMGLENTNER